MKAVLRLRNIGGFKGEKIFEFERGAVNEVEAPNAAGKSSIIRGLAAVLGFPLSDDDIIKEATNQGVLRDSLKNIYEKDAAISLKYNGRFEQLEIRGDGTFGELPEGDERFILAGQLTPEARSIRQLVQGEEDFSWVAARLSRAQRYASAKEFVDSLLVDAESKISGITKRQTDLVEQDKKLKNMMQAKKTFEGERDELGHRLDEKKREHIEKIKGLGKQIDIATQLLSRIEAAISNSEKELEHMKQRLESNANRIASTEQQLQSVDMEAIRTEVSQKVFFIDNEISTLRSHITALNAKKSAFLEAKSVLVQQGESEGPCPICEASTVTVNLLDDKLSELDNELRELESQRQALAADRARWLQKEAAVRQELNKLNQDLKRFRDEDRDLNLRKSREESNLASLRKEANKIVAEQTDLSQKRTLLQKETEQWEAEIHEQLQRIENELQNLSDSIAAQIRRISEASLVEVYGKRTSFEQAQSWLGQYQTKLKEISQYFDQRRHDHEVRAIASFNSNVKKVMADLGFTEFDQIAIDRDDKRLKVFRSGFIRQPVESLSTSEKYSIAIVLQIALKETYVPEIPFFLVDEVVVSYDGIKKEQVIGYLSRMAKEKDLYVVVTKLSETQTGGIRVKAREV